MPGARFDAAVAELQRSGVMYYVDRQGEITPVSIEEYAAIPTEAMRGSAMFVQRTSAEAWAAGMKALRALEASRS